jgi:hypothetical protein
MHSSFPASATPVTANSAHPIDHRAHRKLIAKIVRHASLDTDDVFALYNLSTNPLSAQ